MRLIVSEILKLFSKRVFTICLVVSLFANVFFLVYMQNTNIINSAVAGNKTAYNDLIDECLQQDNPGEFIKSKQLEVQIAMFLNNSATDDDSQYADLQKEKYQKENPVEYENAQKLNLTDEQLQNRFLLIQDILSQLKYAESYDDFINNMESRAENQMSFSIFAQQDSFSYNNIEKTPQDFAHLKNAELSVGNYKAVETSTQFQLTDYLMLVLVVLICIFLFCIEREKGLYALVRSSKHGRLATILSKLGVTVAVTAVISIVFYVSNFVFSGVLFGFGDLSQNIQSSSIFMNCSLDLSMSQYIALWITGKVILFCSFALLLAVVFVVIKTAAKVYALIVVFLFAEFFSFLFIDGNSVLGSFKYINFIYLMTGNNIFGYYQNVNFFSIPVNIITVFIILCLIMIVTGLLGSCVSFAKSTQFAGSSAVLTKISSFISKHSKIRGSVKIFSGEAFKHYKTSFVFAVIIALVVVGAVNLTDDLSIIYSGVEESAYNDYMQTLEGELDDESYAFIENEQNYFDGLAEQQSEIMNDSSLTGTEKESKIMAIQSIIDGKGKAFDRVCEQVAYAQEKATQIGAPPALVNEIVNKRLTEDTFRDWQYFTLMLAVIVFCTSNIFACEYKRSMVNLLRANKCGKTKLLLTKFCTVLLTSTVSFVLIYLPYFINFIHNFGTASFDLPIAFVQDFNLISSDVTVLEYVLVLGAVHFAVAVTATVLISMLSLLLKNNAMTMIVSSGIMLVPCIVAMNIVSMRMMSAFKNDVWLMVVSVLLIACVCVIATSLVVTFKKFNNITWRKKNANA